MPVEQMRHPRRLGGARPRRNDCEVAINLHRVGVDHDAADALGDGKRKCRLAAGGRPCDKHRNLVLYVALHVSCTDPAHRPSQYLRPMTHVATLIAHPAQRMPDDAGPRVARHLPAAGAPAWLDPGFALDMPFTPPRGR